MVDIGIVPAAGAVTVAGHTIRRMTRLLVVRVSSAIVIGKMAGNAGRGKSRILPLFMTIGTGRLEMPALKGEPVMGKRGVFPGIRSVTVADYAIRRKTGLLVVRVSGTVVIRKMAGNAG